MRSRVVVAGHPLHPMLIPFPFAFLTGAVLFDLAGWALDRASFWTTGEYLAAAGVATGLLAAVPGLVDYLMVVPPRSSGKKRATKHMLSNGSALLLFAVAFAVLVRMAWTRNGYKDREGFRELEPRAQGPHEVTL